MMWWLVGALILFQEGSFRLGLLEAQSADGAVGVESDFARGAAFACERWNARGGVGGRSIELVRDVDGGSARGAREALARLAQAEVLAVVLHGAAPDRERAAQTLKRVNTPVFWFGVERVDAIDTLDHELLQRLGIQRLALLHDGSRISRDLRKELDQRLAGAAVVVFEEDLKEPSDKVRAGLAEKLAQLVVLDAEPAAWMPRAAALRAWKLPILLTARSDPASGPVPPPGTLLVRRRHPVTAPGGEEFLAAFRSDHGEASVEHVDGHDALEWLIRALDAAGESQGGRLQKSLENYEFRGPRGRVAYDAAAGHLTAPLAIWRQEDAAAVPYLPPPLVDPASNAPGTTTDRRPGDQDVGEPFGTRRSTSFRLEEDTQWVVFSYGDREVQTIDQDLALLGLSTGGAEPLVDHLVKEELLSRILSITSTLFHREPDGTGAAGSLNISFTTLAPARARKGKVWQAIVAGDDPYAGGRAYPGEGRAEVYATFLRRTIFQEHRLEPPLGPGDLPYLDGRYRYGTHHSQDFRSDLIRALLNGYAGGMALTAAHELGHLAGLGHINDDPVGIMNVEEGAGIDYRDAHFSAGSMERLVERLGVRE